MRVAALQMASNAGDPEANLMRIARGAEAAAARGADLLITPELAVPGYGAGERMRSLAQSTDGPAARQLKGIAAETGLAIVAGFAEEFQGEIFNSALFVNPRGGTTLYRKSHLYGAYERALFRAETPTAVTLEHAGLRLGMVICFDVEFPENVRRLALPGCNLVVAPTALQVGAYAEFIARKMIPVRAFENQIFLAYVNYCGADGKFSYAGLSSIAAPDGSLLAAADAYGESLMIADIDPQRYEKSAAENSYLKDLRI